MMSEEILTGLIAIHIITFLFIGIIFLRLNSLEKQIKEKNK